MVVHELMQKADGYINIVNALAKTHNILQHFHTPACSISGGSDSDIMLHMVHSIDEDNKVRYFWLNTGLEYKATKEHLNFLESKYDIKIERINAVKPIPQCVKEYGQPFLSKFVSQSIHSLQVHGFDFKERSYDEDCNIFGKGQGFSWWHNTGTFKAYNINTFKMLKEFLIAYPPNFKVSDMCCTYSKKKPAMTFVEQNDIDVQIVGVRKAEGGIRQKLKSCFTSSEKRGNIFRPLFWLTDNDKREYEKLFGVTHSDCYTVYGLTRTGCTGCPFNRRLFKDMEAVRNFEHGLVTAASNVFRESYEYTKLYREFLQKQGRNLYFDFSIGGEEY